MTEQPPTSPSSTSSTADDLAAQRSDELVSAVLDGEGSAEQIAQVAADPVLSARLELFRSISVALAPADQSAEHDAGALEAVIERALAAFDDERSTRSTGLIATSTSTNSESTAPGGTVVGAVAPPTLPVRRRAGRLGVLVGSLAAGLLAVALVGGLLQRPGSDDAAETASLPQQRSATTSAADGASQELAEMAADSAQPTRPASSTLAVSSPPALPAAAGTPALLGEFGGAADLAAELRRRGPLLKAQDEAAGSTPTSLVTQTTSTAAAASGVTRCPPPQGSTLLGSAVVAGRAVLVHVTGGSQPELLGVDETSCGINFRERL